MNSNNGIIGKKPKRYILLIVSAVMIIILAVSLWICYRVMQAEAHVRYVGITNVATEKVTKVVHGMKMNAKNVFDEVGKHLDSPDAVIGALQSKTSLNPEVKGYFAAFEPGFFPEKGQWFEPYVHHKDSSLFVVSQVGSARHDYTTSGWYIRAKEHKMDFWSEPYYYQDYDEIGLSGYYCTYVEPVFDEKGSLICVCGADITMNWLAKKLRHIDESARTNAMLNLFHKGSQNFYTVVLNHSGSAIAHPEDKPITITDADMLGNMAKEISGMKDMTVNGLDVRVYYAPIDDIDWTVALVVPKEDIWLPLLLPGLVLLLITIVGIAAIYMLLGKTSKMK